MINLHREISTPVGIVIVLSVALLVIFFIVQQNIKAIEEHQSLEHRYFLKEK
ncbi:MAG: hypothetical protein ABH919_01635 [bacterium]